MNDRQTLPQDTRTDIAEPGLPPGTRLGAFELERVIARGSSSFVYRATDHALALPVAIQEYLPARLVQRDAWLQLHAIDGWHEDVVARGLRAFVEEAQLLAHCNHPALVRVKQLFEANGTAYRVMPLYSGQRLSDLRRDMTVPPDEAALRALLDGLLGALEAIHRNGKVHGGVTPANILLLSDDTPLLLGPGAAAHEIGSDLVASLMASLESPGESMQANPAPSGAIADLRALAEVIRFCITGTQPATLGAIREREPLATVIGRSFEPAARPRYSAALLGTLDAAMSPFAEDWPLGTAQFRDWLQRGAPRPRAAEPPAKSAAPRPSPAPAPVSAPSSAPASAPTPAEPKFEPFSFFSPPADESQPASPLQPPLDAAIDDDPMLTDRAHWIPPEMAAAPVASGRRARRYKLIFGGVLTALAVVVVAVATGVWNLVPSITLDRLETAAQRAAATAPAEPLPSPPREPTAPAPNPNPAPETAPETATARAQTPAPTPIPTQTPTPTPEQPPAPAEPATATAASPSDSPVAAAAAPDPERTLAANPPAPGPAPAPTRKSAEASVASPRAACATRTEFALYRCMLQQCQAARWAKHPQCVRLRATDSVD